MNLCSDGHDEVCFEGRVCPMCSITDTKDREIKALEDKVAELKSEVDDLSSAN